MIGKQLSHFRILDKLGEGGMGVVYRAEDEKLGRDVALKVLQASAVGDTERRVRFIREARTAASISHPHIATVHEIDESADGTVFIAMELVEGETLSRKIDRGQLPVREVLRYAVEIAEALARAHEAGIVHRDLKPENVIARPDGHVKILDFGLAKLRERRQPKPQKTTPHDKTLSMNVTREGRVMGTANYMSPEQARGLEVDGRSDLFSFGILLYELVTGRKPFESETITDTLSAITRDEPVPPAELNPQVPLELQRIISKCLEKDPKDRYQHADEIAVDLRRVRRDSDSQARIGDVPSGSPASLRTARPLGRRLALAAAGAAVLVTALVGLPLLVGRGGATRSAETRLNSVAIMPIENLADAADADQLGRILQDLIITDLSGIDSLRVFSSQRLYDLRKQIRGGAADVIDSSVATEVAKRAGAKTMLTGSLSQLGPKWTLTAQLVSVRDGSVLKSERVDGADLYAMVDDLTARLRTDLGVVPAGDEDVMLASVRDKTTESIEAYRHYLEGVELLNLDRREEAVRALERAVEIDPTFGKAYFKLAVASWWWAGDQKGSSSGEPTRPQAVLEKLLAGEIKLTRKDRMLAEALQPLVSYRYEQARPRFERLVEEYPDEKEAWYGLGEARRHSPGGHKDPEALRAFERALELDPAFGIAYVHVDEYYQMQRLYDDAIRKVSELIELAPEAPMWQVVLSRWFARKGETDRALTTLEAALGRIEEPGDRVEALTTLAGTFGWERHDFGTAEKLLDRAIALDVEERLPGVFSQLGWGYRRQGRRDEADAAFRKALELDPRHAEALEGAFTVLADQGRFETAVAEARRLVEADPEFVVPYRLWIRSAIVLGDQAELERAIKRALVHAEAQNDERWVWLAAAEAASKIGDAERQREYLDRAYAIDEQNDYQMLGQMGWNALDRRDHETARDLLERALERLPDQGNLLVGLTQLHFERGDYERSSALARKLSEQMPDSSNARRWQIASQFFSGDEPGAAESFRNALDELHDPLERRQLHWEVAGIYEAAGRWEEAERLARQAVELGPGLEHEEALQRWAFILGQLGRYDEAEAALDAALDLAPESWALRGRVAALELQRGRAAEAERALEQILEAGPDHRILHTLLAYAFAEQGKFREAEREARRAVEMCATPVSLSALAWVLIAGELDLEDGIRVAEHARRIPASFWELGVGAYQASPEHALGLAYLKQGKPTEAVRLLEQAAADRPDRSLIRQHLADARARL